MKCNNADKVHYFTEETLGGVPFCDCGKIRNPYYKRNIIQKILGLPRFPKSY